MGALNIAGLLLSLAGVILLFRYGMPYRLQLPGEPITAGPSPGMARNWPNANAAP